MARTRKAAGLRGRRRADPAGETASALDHDAILAAADRVVRRERLAGFSMRKLAEELGATAMAVYRYFPNKGALLDALVDRGMDGAALPAMRAAPWPQRARALASLYRARLLESPETMPWVLSRVGVSPGALRNYDAALSIVRESGLPDRDVVRVVDAMVSFVMGFVAIEVARQGAGTRGRGYRSLVPHFLQLPAREFPTLLALAPHAGDFDDELFEFGLDLLLAGAAARVPTATKRPRSRR